MRKKFTMLFASLLLCVGAWAQTITYLGTSRASELKEGTKYMIYNATNAQDGWGARCGVIYNNNGNVAIDASLEPKTLITTETKYLWEVVKGAETNQYSIKSVSTGEYAAIGGAISGTTNTVYITPWADAVEAGFAATDGSMGFNNEAGERVAIANATAADYLFTVSLAANGGTCWNGNPGSFATWSTAHPITFYEVKEVTTVTIQYSFVYNEEVKYEETVTGVVGESYPAYSTNLPFGVVAAMPEGTVSSDVTEATIELSPAFSWADSYENITAWYYLDLKDGKYLYYEENQTNIPLDKTEVDSNNKDAYTWGFIGDPFNGFQIVNRAAGSSMILSSTTNTFDGNTGGSTYPVMTAIPVPEGNNTHWVFTASSYRENGFFIGQKDANNGNNRLNNRDGKLAYWNGGADGGSTFVMVERPMGAAAELAALVEEIEAMGIVSGENIGDYTVASVTALNEAVAAAKAVETATAENVTTLQAALDGLRVVLPDADKFYAFNCVYENRKLYINANDQLTYAQNYDLTNSRAVFQFEEGSQPNTVKIKSVHNQSYMGAISGNPITFGDTGADITIARSVSNELTDEQKTLAVMFTTDGSNGLHANGGNVQAYTNVAISNHYILSEVTEFSHTLTIDEYDYMTLTLGFNAEVPEGVTAYKVTGAEGKELVLESVGNVIPAGEPVIVYAEVAEGETKDAEFAYTTTEATKSDDNLLKGTLIDGNVAPTEGYDAYVMALNGSEVVMGKAMLNVNENTQFKNRANKAYLELLQEFAAGAPMFSFGRGEGTTGIENSELNIENPAFIYDLLGRRVEKMEKGIYIVNGKKVIR